MLVGRESLTAALSGLGATRLLTLTGPGGTGKTRLALQLAAESVDRFPDGTWFVALDSVTDPSVVVPAIAITVGATIGPTREPLDVLVEFLTGKRVLLVLDNFEQVLDAAPVIAGCCASCPT